VAGFAVSVAAAAERRVAGFFAAPPEPRDEVPFRVPVVRLAPLFGAAAGAAAGAATVALPEEDPPVRFPSAAVDVFERRAVPVVLVPDFVVIVAPLAAQRRRSWWMSPTLPTQRRRASRQMTGRPAAGLGPWPRRHQVAC